MTDEDRPLDPDEFWLLMKPHLLRLIEKHGTAKANMLLKDAVRRAGLNPDDFSIEKGNPS